MYYIIHDGERVGTDDTKFEIAYSIPFPERRDYNQVLDFLETYDNTPWTSWKKLYFYINSIITYPLVVIFSRFKKASAEFYRILFDIPLKTTKEAKGKYYDDDVPF